MPDNTADKLFLGAPECAQAVFGSDDEKYCRIIYHWRSLPPERRPAFLVEVAGRPAIWRSALERHAGRHTDPPTDSSESSDPTTTTKR
jgi:hypothetical protein